MKLKTIKISSTNLPCADFPFFLSSFLRFSKDGLKLGSSFQQFVIISYLKHKEVKDTSVYVLTALS